MTCLQNMFRKHFYLTHVITSRRQKCPLKKSIRHSDRHTQMHTYTCSLWHTLIHIHHLQSLYRSSRPNLCHILLGVTQHERCMHDILERGYTPWGNDFRAVLFGLVRSCFLKVVDFSAGLQSLNVKWRSFCWSRTEPCTVLKKLSSISRAQMGFTVEGRLFCGF